MSPSGDKGREERERREKRERQEQERNVWEEVLSKTEAKLKTIPTEYNGSSENYSTRRREKYKTGRDTYDVNPTAKKIIGDYHKATVEANNLEIAHDRAWQERSNEAHMGSSYKIENGLNGPGHDLLRDLTHEIVRKQVRLVYIIKL